MNNIVNCTACNEYLSVAFFLREKLDSKLNKRNYYF